MNKTWAACSGLEGLLCLHAFAWAWRTLSRITVCGNGTFRWELFITIRMTYSQLMSPACALYHVVMRRHSLVSYQCTVGNMKTQQEAVLMPRVRVDTARRAGAERYIQIRLQDFVPLRLRFSWQQRQVVTTVLSFGNLLCDTTGEKKKRS